MTALRAEWTKFRTVRGWVAGMIVAVLATVALGYLYSSGSTCSSGSTPSDPQGHACTAPLGPGGEPVTDSFYFVHRTLAGDGSLTVRLTSLAAADASLGGGQTTTGVQPWSKGGIIIKQSTRQGSAYAAMMVTSGHGVRMQYDYTHDAAGLPGAVSPASPRWLRLTRSGDTVTGYDSADGAHWREVGAATLAGLPATVLAGMFATSPAPVQTSAGTSSATGPSEVAAAFDNVSSRGGWSGAAWAGTTFGAARPAMAGLGAFHQAGAKGTEGAKGGSFTVSGSGDIAPDVAGTGVETPISRTLVGVFAGLIAVTVVATMFITAEYRHGLIRATLAATPRRGRVLLAKALVIGAVTFVAGLIGAAVCVPLGDHFLRAHGNFIAPVPALTQVRVIVGTAALLAAAAVFALGLGAVLRRSAGAVTTVIVGIALPYLFTVTAPFLPGGAADWLLRVTPAAAFAVQQTSPRYPQVSSTYWPFFGYYPLAPWAGFAVLCGYAALALALAAFLLHRRDA
jgi:hypothetical protein